MSKEVEGIVHAQLDLYGRIARCYDNLKKMGSANITLVVVKARIQTLEAYWLKFETQHDKLVRQHWDSLAGHEYQTKDMQSLVEDIYLQQKGMFLDALRALGSKLGGDIPTAGASDDQRSARAALPRIQLPHFSGRYEEWPPFRDLFQSIVGVRVESKEVSLRFDLLIPPSAGRGVGSDVGERENNRVIREGAS